jgi:hypothetical protein
LPRHLIDHEYVGGPDPRGCNYPIGQTICGYPPEHHWTPGRAAVPPQRDEIADLMWSHDGVWPPNPHELHNQQVEEAFRRGSLLGAVAGF